MSARSSAKPAPTGASDEEERRRQEGAEHVRETTAHALAKKLEVSLDEARGMVLPFIDAAGSLVLNPDETDCGVTGAEFRDSARERYRGDNVAAAIDLRAYFQSQVAAAMLHESRAADDERQQAAEAEQRRRDDEAATIKQEMSAVHEVTCRAVAARDGLDLAAARLAVPPYVDADGVPADGAAADAGIGDEEFESAALATYHLESRDLRYLVAVRRRFQDAADAARGGNAAALRKTARAKEESRRAKADARRAKADAARDAENKAREAAARAVAAEAKERAERAAAEKRAKRDAQHAAECAAERAAARAAAEMKRREAEDEASRRQREEDERARDGAALLTATAAAVAAKTGKTLAQAARAVAFDDIAPACLFLDVTADGRFGVTDSDFLAAATARHGQAEAARLFGLRALLKEHAAAMLPSERKAEAKRRKQAAARTGPMPWTAESLTNDSVTAGAVTAGSVTAVSLADAGRAPRPVAESAAAASAAADYESVVANASKTQTEGSLGTGTGSGVRLTPGAAVPPRAKDSIKDSKEARSHRIAESVAALARHAAANGGTLRGRPAAAAALPSSALAAAASAIAAAADESESSDSGSSQSSDSDADDAAVAAVAAAAGGDAADAAGGGGRRATRRLGHVGLDWHTLAAQPWEVSLSADASSTLGRLDRPQLRAVSNRLTVLASGRWLTGRRVTRARHTTGDTVMLKIKFSKRKGGGRILFDVDEDYSEARGEYYELIRVWAIVPSHDNQAAAIRAVDDAIQSSSKSKAKGRESRQVALLADVTAGGEDADGQRALLALGLGGGRSRTSRDADGVLLVLPRTFKRVDAVRAGDESERPGLIRHAPPACPNADSFTLSKFFTLSSGMIHAAFTGEAGGVISPFRLPPEEHELITLEPRPASSLLLMGRSGTGKTTVTVRRMYALHLNPLAGSKLLDGGRSGFRQVFVTANPVLRSEVRKHFLGLLRGRAAELSAAAEAAGADAFESRAHADAAAESVIAIAAAAAGGAEAVPHSFVALPDSAFPLFLTKREFLVCADGCLPSPFFEREADGTTLTPAAREIAFGAEEGGALQAIDSDSDDGGGGDDIDDGSDADGSAATREDGQGDERTEFKLEADFEFFVSSWEELIVSKGKGPGAISAGAAGLTPALCWAEIVSFIKGSLGSLAASEPSSGSRAFLSKEAYMELGRKKSHMTPPQREAVYTVFERYERLRSRAGAYDLMDAVAYIYSGLVACASAAGQGHALGGAGLGGIPLPHSIFVDEVQDFNEAELRLTLAMCRDPNRLFLAGDTAQTIAKGISFRFEDLKSIFHDARERGGAVAVPASVLKLTKNYRTHTGVLELANGVIDLVHAFFKGAVDKLPPDAGLFTGPRPLLMASSDIADLFSLLRRSSKSKSSIEFGARQVILVRSQDAKEALAPELRSGALVCTVFESKGLEFDDVLIMNFWKDSPATARQWRAILDPSVDGPGAAAHAAAARCCSPDVAGVRAAAFEMVHDKILLDELRHLYTALTRARVNVWIFDEDLEKRAPAFAYFFGRELVRWVPLNAEISAPESEQFGLALKGADTSADEWIYQGRVLLEKDLFEPSSTCFRNAARMLRDSHRESEADVCELQALRADARAAARAARRLPKGSEDQVELYVKAADLFLRSRSSPVDGVKEASVYLANGRVYAPAARLMLLLGLDPIKAFDLALRSADTRVITDALAAVPRGGVSLEPAKLNRAVKICERSNDKADLARLFEIQGKVKEAVAIWVQAKAADKIEALVRRMAQSHSLEPRIFVKAFEELKAFERGGQAFAAINRPAEAIGLLRAGAKANGRVELLQEAVALREGLDADAASTKAENLPTVAALASEWLQQAFSHNSLEHARLAAAKLPLKQTQALASGAGRLGHMILAERFSAQGPTHAKQEAERRLELGEFETAAKLYSTAADAVVLPLEFPKPRPSAADVVKGNQKGMKKGGTSEANAADADRSKAQAAAAAAAMADAADLWSRAARCLLLAAAACYAPPQSTLASSESHKDDDWEAEERRVSLTESAAKAAADAQAGDLLTQALALATKAAGKRLEVTSGPVLALQDCRMELARHLLTMAGREGGSEGDKSPQDLIKEGRSFIQLVVTHFTPLAGGPKRHATQAALAVCALARLMAGDGLESLASTLTASGDVAAALLAWSPSKPTEITVQGARDFFGFRDAVPSKAGSMVAVDVLCHRAYPVLVRQAAAAGQPPLAAVLGPPNVPEPDAYRAAAIHLLEQSAKACHTAVEDVLLVSDRLQQRRLASCDCATAGEGIGCMACQIGELPGGTQHLTSAAAHLSLLEPAKAVNAKLVKHGGAAAKQNGAGVLVEALEKLQTTLVSLLTARLTLNGPASKAALVSQLGGVAIASSVARDRPPLGPIPTLLLTTLLRRLDRDHPVMISLAESLAGVGKEDKRTRGPPPEDPNGLLDVLMLSRLRLPSNVDRPFTYLAANIRELLRQRGGAWSNAHTHNQRRTRLEAALKLGEKPLWAAEAAATFLEVSLKDNSAPLPSALHSLDLLESSLLSCLIALNGAPDGAPHPMLLPGAYLVFHAHLSQLTMAGNNPLKVYGTFTRLIAVFGGGGELGPGGREENSRTAILRPSTIVDGIDALLLRKSGKLKEQRDIGWHAMAPGRYAERAALLALVLLKAGYEDSIRGVLPLLERLKESRHGQIAGEAAAACRQYLTAVKAADADAFTTYIGHIDRYLAKLAASLGSPLKTGLATEPFASWTTVGTSDGRASLPVQHKPTGHAFVSKLNAAAVAFVPGKKKGAAAPAVVDDAEERAAREADDLEAAVQKLRDENAGRVFLRAYRRLQQRRAQPQAAPAAAEDQADADPQRKILLEAGEAIMAIGGGVCRPCCEAFCELGGNNDMTEEGTRKFKEHLKTPFHETSVKSADAVKQQALAAGAALVTASASLAALREAASSLEDQSPGDLVASSASVAIEVQKSDLVRVQNGVMEASLALNARGAGNDMDRWQHLVIVLQKSAKDVIEACAVVGKARDKIYSKVAARLAKVNREQVNRLGAGDAGDAKAKSLAEPEAEAEVDEPDEELMDDGLDDHDSADDDDDDKEDCEAPASKARTGASKKSQSRSQAKKKSKSKRKKAALGTSAR